MDISQLNSTLSQPNLTTGGSSGSGANGSSLFSSLINNSNPLLSSIMSLIGGNNIQGNTQQGINDANSAQQTGFTNAINTTNAAFSPYQATGVNALNTLNSGNVVNPQQQNLMNFAQQSGNSAILGNAASSGQFFSPETLQALSQFNQENAGQFYQQAFTNQYNLANLGLNASKSSVGALTPLQTGSANANANAALATASNKNTGTNNILSAAPGIISGIAQAAPAIASLF